jgi:hypothetical protein
MNIAKKLSGLKSALEFKAGEGLTLLGDSFQIDHSIVTTDTQLSTLADTLVTQDALATAIDPFITSPQLRDVTDFLMDTLASKDALATAIDTLVSEDQLTDATNTLASKSVSNVFEGANRFDRHTLFNQMCELDSKTDMIREVPDTGVPIFVFRELESLRSHWTAPTWVTVTLDPEHFAADGFYADGPQYTTFRYGSSSMVKMRGEVKEKGDYFNATENRVLFVLPAGHRPLKRHMFVCGGGSGGVAASVLVNTNGDVLFMPLSSVVEPAESVKTLWLDPISFFTN